MALLKCVNLVPGYGVHAVCEPLTFSVEAGDYLSILGENGSGKSTLMRTLLGLQTPVSGELHMGDGLSFSRIGYLPQRSSVQKDFPASVMEVVLSGCQGKHFLQPFYTREEKRLARQQLQRLGALELAERCYRELSGGQQQRVLLARALCATEQLLLLDEPVAGLDPQAMEEMYALLRELNRKQGLTVVMISHDIVAALRDSSRILRLGSTCFLGSAEEAGRRFGRTDIQGGALP